VSVFSADRHHRRGFQYCILELVSPNLARIDFLFFSHYITCVSKKRGAQPGNTNALKHGFYSRFFTDGECTDLSEISPDLVGEIAMLRVLNLRVFARLSNMETVPKEYDHDKYLDFASLLSSVSVRLSTLLRANQFLTGHSLSSGEELKLALEDAIREMGIE